MKKIGRMISFKGETIMRKPCGADTSRFILSYTKNFGRYAPKSNQLLISMDQNYEENLVLILTLVFDLARPQPW